LSERKNFAAPEEMAHIDAKILAYQEFIAILKASAKDFNIPSSEIGL
jgi:hypothetical protein